MSGPNRVRWSTTCSKPGTRAVILALAFGMVLFSVAAFAQDTQSQPQQTTDQKQKQAPPPAAGGPQGDLGPIAIPKKTDQQQQSTPLPPPAPKVPTGMPNYSVTVDVPLVNLDVMALTKDGHFIPGLRKEFFRVTENGVPQQLQGFSQSQAPITAVLLIEFSNTNYRFMYDALNAAYAFADTLKKDDYVAVVEYDMKPNILLDFTQDKQKVYAALNELRVPGFSESNLFDALYDTLDRLDRIQGRKEIVVVGSGLDTFSRITYDKVLKKIKDTPNVTIFTVSTGRAFLEAVDAQYGQYQGVQEQLMNYLQADNEMNTFARMTGGRWYNPRFEAEFPDIFRDIGQSVRNQYTLTYRPTDAKQDGTYRKLNVQLVAPGTDKPLIIRDQKNKILKYQLIYRAGYTAKHEVE